MPSGKTHQIITEKTTGLVTLAAYFSSKTLIEKDWMPTGTIDVFYERASNTPLLGLLTTIVVIFGISLSLKGLARGKKKKKSQLEKGIALLTKFSYFAAVLLFLIGSGLSTFNEIDTSIQYSLFLSTILASCYFFAGKMFSGDLDLVSMQTKSWGMFRFIWIPYRKMFSHRSAWTHGVFLGTVFRIVYLSAWIFIPLLGLAYYLDVSVDPFAQKILNSFTAFPVTYITIFIGLLLGSASHTIADKIVSFWKKHIEKF